MIFSRSCGSCEQRGIVSKTKITLFPRSRNTGDFCGCVTGIRTDRPPGWRRRASEWAAADSDWSWVVAKWRPVARPYSVARSALIITDDHGHFADACFEQLSPLSLKGGT